MECDQCPPCLIPEFTPDCTDDCLVLACDDPAHPLQPCHDSCIAAPACSDCPALDEILHCCTWDHSIHDLSSVSTSLSPSFKCLWAHCNAVFSTLSELVGHVNLQHLCPVVSPPLEIPQQPSFSCHWGDCASSIPSSSDDHILNVLASHLMQDHLGIHYPPSESLFPPLSDLHDSVPPSHSPPNPLSSESTSHSCKWKGCTESFPSCDDLTTHIASVHIGAGKAHYECFWEDCTRHDANGFSSKQKISRHLQSHTGHRPFQCQICNQSFSEATTLQQHMRRHTQEKPYVCDFPGCGKAFAITGALTIHKRTHNGLRPFKCKFCDRAFSESSNLTKHLRTHTGARPYTCTEQGCEKAFARPDQLARHMNVHRKKPSNG